MKSYMERHPPSIWFTAGCATCGFDRLCRKVTQADQPILGSFVCERCRPDEHAEGGTEFAIVDKNKQLVWQGVAGNDHDAVTRYRNTAWRLHKYTLTYDPGEADIRVTGNGKTRYYYEDHTRFPY